MLLPERACKSDDARRASADLHSGRQVRRPPCLADAAHLCRADRRRQHDRRRVRAGVRPARDRRVRHICVARDHRADRCLTVAARPARCRIDRGRDRLIPGVLRRHVDLSHPGTAVCGRRDVPSSRNGRRGAAIALGSPHPGGARAGGRCPGARRRVVGAPDRGRGLLDGIPSAEWRPLRTEAMVDGRDGRARWCDLERLFDRPDQRPRRGPRRSARGWCNRVCLAEREAAARRRRPGYVSGS
jgi:hypothetical protein